MALISILKLVLLASIIATVFSLALRARATDVLYLFRHPELGVRAFIAMFVIVPAAAIGIVAAFEVHPAVEIAVVALALSPIAPILPKRQLRVGAPRSYITGLLCAATIVSLLVVPLGLMLVGKLLGINVSLSPLRIIPILAMGIAAPLTAGLVVQKLLGQALAWRVSAVVAKVANVVLIVCVLVLLYVFAPAMWTLIGNGTLLALTAMIVAGLVAGYLLAGGGVEERVGLALASAARHPGLAITIATATFPDEKLAPAAILLSTIIGAITSVPLLRRIEAMDGVPPAPET